MKRIKYSIGAILVSTLMLSSCSESFFDNNTDPNNPAEATPSLVLPSAVAGSAYVLGGYYQAVGSFWTQQYAQAPASSQWTEWESYNLTEENFNTQFETLYTGALYDYEYVRKNTAASESWSFYAISTLMQAYTFQVLADLYDQVPFTEALQGDKILQPHYNTGATVYDSLLVRIDDAMSKDFSNSSSVKPGVSDVIFKGDMDKWQKFANTLKLKMYLRYVNVDSTKYTDEIVALLAENNFLQEDAAFSSYKAEETGYNPFYNTFMHRLGSNIIANSTLVDLLTEKGDSRLESFFDASETGSTYTGLASGLSKSITGKTNKEYATPNITGLSSVYFFTVEETYFLIAEAQARYGTPAAAEAAYKSGIDASFESLGLPTVAATLYPYNGIKSIMEQKWIASTNKRAIEAFLDYNRTGYPDFFTTSAISVLNGADRPKRFFFPTGERKTNANTPTKVALNVNVWWGKTNIK